MFAGQSESYDSGRSAGISRPVLRESQRSWTHDYQPGRGKPRNIISGSGMTVAIAMRQHDHVDNWFRIAKTYTGILNPR